MVRRLNDKKYLVSFDKTVIDRISELNSQEEYGARPIKRMLQKYVEDTLADLMVQGKIGEGSTVTLSYDPAKEAAMQIPVKVKINTKKENKPE